MAAALLLSLVYLAISALEPRAPPQWLLVAGSVCLRVMLILVPPAARNAIALLNCTPVQVPSAGAAGLDGGTPSTSSSGRSGSSTTTVSVLASNPYFVCWTAGASHFAAGALAVSTLLCVVVATPLLAFVRLAFLKWRHRSASGGLGMHGLRSKHDLPEGPRIHSVAAAQAAPPLSHTAVEQLAISFTSNPLRDPSAARRAATHTSVARVKHNSEPDKPAPTSCPPLLSPFAGDYRPEAWYTRHCELGLTLLLASFQVRSKAHRSLCDFRHHPAFSRTLEFFSGPPASACNSDSAHRQGSSRLCAGAPPCRPRAVGAPLRRGAGVEEPREFNDLWRILHT